MPMLLVLLFGLADFARVFAAGITLEAAARNGAEAAAQEYLQVLRNKTGGLDAADYDAIHAVAIDAVCSEGETLPNQAVSGGTCSMPVTAVCVHDGADPACGTEAAIAPSSCPRVSEPSWNATELGAAPGGATPLPFVEVRVCYRFTTLFNLTNLELPFGWGVSLGEVYLERDRQFVVANY